jgi:shikimate dehydrogenase
MPIKTKKYGLIGYPLEHSFSPAYFSKKFKDEKIQNCEYKLYPLARIADFKKLDLSSYSGLNVTIPYKKAVIPYLDALDAEAESVGAVNTIVFKNKQLIGFNTDIFGFQLSLEKWFKSVNRKPENALILGRGGATRAVRFVLKKMAIRNRTISRKNKRWNYQYLTQEDIENHQLIINTTPLGMVPNIEQSPPIPYDAITNNHFLYDLVYNPEKTVFLKEGLRRGAKIKNGLEMLYFQAEKAWEIWNQ